MNEGEKQRYIMRYEENPFLCDMVIPVRDQRVKISRLGQDDNVLVNQSTGEVSGTHVATFKSVDSEQFVKLFSTNIALAFDLGQAGIKALTILIWTLQDKSISKDLLPFDKYVLDAFLKAHPKKDITVQTLGRGIAELEEAKIIAKHVRKGWYFINPNFVFNGDRIAFSTIIEKKKRNNEQPI